MKITFLGAAKTVTGSCFYVETDSVKFLVDCGMFQGFKKDDELNQEDFPFNPQDLDYVLLTHAHIDHSGRIPKLYTDGFKGQVIATKATAELCAIMLPDSGYIQELENEWINRKRKRAGKTPVKPLYTYQDALNSLKLFRSVKYGETVELAENLKVRFNDAGHILGSSIIEVWAMEDGKQVKVVFSGDLGNKDMPIIRDPSIIKDADYLVIESTYGNRLHIESERKVERFVDALIETVDNGGNVIIPSFAVGRTQEVIYELNKHMDIYHNYIEKLAGIPVFVDSPLAISATQVFRNNLDCFDEEARDYIAKGDNPLDFPGLQFTRTADESKSLNTRKGSMIIISASGMCDAGRIKHHLKHNLWKKESTVIFVGYQAQGTLGRKLVDGAKKVKIFGEEIHVNARIVQIEGFSGHADLNGLLDWIGGFESKPKRIFLVHGEEEALQNFAKSIGENYGIDTVIPERGSAFLITPEGEIEEREKAVSDISYRRLAVIDLLEALKEELDEIYDTVTSSMTQEKSEQEIEELLLKLKNVENSMQQMAARDNV